MDALLEILKIILPATAVLYAMYLTINAFLNKDFEKRLLEIKLKQTEQILPIRLQAYERVCMLLERISPNNLIIRVNENEFNSGFFHQKLLFEIREEFNHNLSQQVYISEEAWQLVKGAVQEINKVINTAAQQVDPESSSIELAKAVFEIMMAQEQDPIQAALLPVKAEIQKLF